MKSMGLTNLRLVKPHRRNSGEAVARAMSARDVLSRAQEFSSLEEAIADCDLVIATSGKITAIDLPRYTPRQAAKLLWDLERAHQPQGSVDATLAPAIVFGRESRGLTRSEVSLCHGYITIPTHPDCSSLNLASALQVIAYEHFVLRTALASTAELDTSNAHSLASSRQRAHLFALLEELAIEVGALNPKRPRQMSRRLSELLSRAHPRSAEVSLLQSILGRALRLIQSAEASTRIPRQID